MAGVSAPGVKRKAQLPRSLPGRFMRDAEPSPSRSWAGTIATFATDIRIARIICQWMSRAATSAGSDGS